jgi:hypothetical protein
MITASTADAAMRWNDNRQPSGRSDRNRSRKEELKMATAKPSMVEQVLALHRQHYGDEFAVVVQDEDLVPRVLQLLIERR